MFWVARQYSQFTKFKLSKSSWVTVTMPTTRQRFDYWSGTYICKAYIFVLCEFGCNLWVSMCISMAPAILGFFCEELQKNLV